MGPDLVDDLCPCSHGSFPTMGPERRLSKLIPFDIATAIPATSGFQWLSKGASWARKETIKLLFYGNLA